MFLAKINPPLEKDQAPSLSAWIRKKRRISSHPISIPITKRRWTTKHRSASSASLIVSWLIDSLAMDWLRSYTIESPSSLTYWSHVQSINTSSKKPVTIKNQVEVTLSFPPYFIVFVWVSSTFLFSLSEVELNFSVEHSLFDYVDILKLATIHMHVRNSIINISANRIK